MCARVCLSVNGLRPAAYTEHRMPLTNDNIHRRSVLVNERTIYIDGYITSIAHAIFLDFNRLIIYVYVSH